MHFPLDKRIHMRYNKFDYKTVTDHLESYAMYKKYGLKRICAMLAAVVISIGAFGLSSGRDVITGSADETKDKYESQLEELKKQQADIDEKIAEAQRKIDEENTNLEAINDKYRSLKEKIKNVEAQTKEIEDQMVDLDSRLRDAQYELELQNAEIEKNKDEFMERIRVMYVAGGANSYSNVLVNASDFYDVLMRVELVKRVAAHDDEELDLLMEQKRAIEETERLISEQSDKLKTKQQDYSEKQTELAEEQAELLKMKEESGSVITDLENDRDALMIQSQSIASDYAKISSLAETTTTAETTAKATSGSGDKSSTTTKKTTEKTTTKSTEKTTENTDEPAATKQTTTTAPKTTTTTAAAEPEPVTPPSGQDKIDTVISYAKSNVGGAYVWGGASYRACDCSGLIMLSFAQVGISIPHFAASQANYGTTVSYGNLQPGDVVFFGGSTISSIYHVALYIGDGRIVHAENSNTGIVISNLATFSKYNNITICKRIL